MLKDDIFDLKMSETRCPLHPRCPLTFGIDYISYNENYKRIYALISQLYKFVHLYPLSFLYLV